MRQFMTIIEQALAEKAHPDRLIMYHGTNSWAAREIAKMGFVPEPEDRNYGDDSELQSYPGSYFTNSLAVAMKYAWESGLESANGPAIVVAQIDLVNAVPDEDVVFPAFRTAMKQKSADAFVRAFHHELVGGHDEVFNCPKDLLLAMRAAYVAWQSDKGDDYEENEIVFREKVDQVCRAYARMAFHTNPRYLGGHDGHHTVRLPQGLGVEHLISIYDFGFDSLDDGYAEGIDGLQLTVVMGQRPNEDEIIGAAQEAYDNGSFS